MKKAVIAVLALLIAAAAAGWWVWHKPPARDGIVLYGNVDIRQVSLAFETSGRITSLMAEEGQRVKAGEVLGMLDKRAIGLELDQARARLQVQEAALSRLRNGTRPQELEQARASQQAADARLEFARQDAARMRRAAGATGGQAVARQQVDQAQASLRVAEAQAEQARLAFELAQEGPRKEDLEQAEAAANAARADIALLEHRLGLTTLRAPVDAVVRSRLLEPGDMASPQRPAFALALTNPKWIRAYISEPQLGQVKPGMKAQVFVDSHPGQAIAGTVGYISSVAQFTPKTVQTEDLRTSLVYEIRIVVDDPEDSLRLGMPVTVRFAAGAGEGAGPS